MKDRIPGSPGRYSARLPVGELEKMQNGEPFAITLIRDDEPIVAGTPYSKAAVLPDALAQKLCPNIADPSPADAFAALEKNKVPTTRPTLINVDINNYVGGEYVGTYWCATGCTNAPFDEYFYLEVNGNFQRATNYSDNKVKNRFYVNNAWTEWTEPYVSIVDAGTGNGWTYRKWSNGDAECWKELSLNYTGGVAMSTSSTLPFSFIEKPIATGGLSELGRASTTYDLLFELTKNAVTVSVEGSFVDGSSAKVSTHVLGRWK